MEIAPRNVKLHAVAENQNEILLEIRDGLINVQPLFFDRPKVHWIGDNRQIILCNFRKGFSDRNVEIATLIHALLRDKNNEKFDGEW